MNLSDFMAQRLPQEAVSRELAARIKGRADVEPLRRMMRGQHTQQDVQDSLEWAIEELRAVCDEDWGPFTPLQSYEGYDQIRKKTVLLPPATFLHGEFEEKIIALSWSEKTPQLKIVDSLVALRNAIEKFMPHEEVATPHAKEAIKIPKPDGLDYMPFQEEGIRWALPYQHALIADEPGLGKTLEAIGVINVLDPKRVVVVCPASLKINWQREAEKWLVKPRTIGIASGMDFPDVDMLILNYDIADRRPLTIIERGIDLLILDEVHFIKSKDSKRTIACTKLIKAAKRGLYLSGTPMLNKPIELYPLLSAVGSPLAADYPRRYCGARMKEVFVKGGQKRRVYDDSGAQNLDDLKEKLRETFMLRRLKSEVLTELPEKRRRTLALADVVGAEDFAKRATELLKEVDMEAIVGGEKPPPLELSSIALLRHEEALAKIPQAMDYAHELLEDEGVQKLVIFAHHRDVLEVIYESLKDFKPVILYGGMTPEQKQCSVDVFQNDESCRVFVGGILAAGVGITLTAASRVLFVEIDWVPANMTQAEDRCHRKGQQNSVLIEHLVVPEGIDERICRALLRKQEILDKAI